MSTSHPVVVGGASTGAVPWNFSHSTGLPCTSVTSTAPLARSARSTTWNAPYPTTCSPRTGPGTVTAGTNGVTTAFGVAVGGAELTWMPSAVTRTASGCAQIGWLSGPVRAEVHHWLVGNAEPRPWPACAGPWPGRAGPGRSGATLPGPAGCGASMGEPAAASPAGDPAPDDAAAAAVSASEASPEPAGPSKGVKPGRRERKG